MPFHHLLSSISSLQDPTKLAAFAYLRQHQNSHPHNSRHLTTLPIRIVSITVKPTTTIIQYIIITVCSNCYSSSSHCCLRRLSSRHRSGHREGSVVSIVLVLPVHETCHSNHFDLHLRIDQNSYRLRLLQRLQVSCWG